MIFSTQHPTSLRLLDQALIFKPKVIIDNIRA